MATLNLDQIREALAGNAAAFRSITEYQPAGGPGDKVFPPTYEGGSYATEQRYIDGEEVTCVLLDSVQSQANRMEMALLDEWESGRAPLPVISVNFTKDDVPNPLRITSLDAPHRIVDALLRDSELDGVMFRQSATGKRLDDARHPQRDCSVRAVPHRPGLRHVGLHRPPGRLRGQVPADPGFGNHRHARSAGQENQQPA